MGKEVGPITGAALKSLADDGTIERDTLVRKGEDGNWALAERVKGLFRVAPKNTIHTSEIIEPLKTLRPPIPEPLSIGNAPSRKLVIVGGVLLATVLVLLGAFLFLAKLAVDKATVARERAEQLRIEQEEQEDLRNSELEAINKRREAMKVERNLRRGKAAIDRQEREEQQSKEIEIYTKNSNSQILKMQDMLGDIKYENSDLERQMRSSESPSEKIAIRQRISANNRRSRELALELAEAGTEQSRGVLKIRSKYVAEELAIAESDLVFSKKQENEAILLEEARQRLQGTGP